MTETEYWERIDKRDKQEAMRREEMIADARKQSRSDAFVQCKDVSTICAIALFFIKSMIATAVFGDNNLLLIINEADCFFWIAAYRFILYIKE